MGMSVPGGSYRAPELDNRSKVSKSRRGPPKSLSSLNSTALLNPGRVLTEPL